MMLGGALTGGLIMAFDVTLKAPHGGIFVFFAIGNLVWFLLALAVGTAVGAVAVIAAKQFASKKDTPAESSPALANA
jgi:PTS system fructose-specific IIC component